MQAWTVCAGASFYGLSRLRYRLVRVNVWSIGLLEVSSRIIVTEGKHGNARLLVR